MPAPTFNSVALVDDSWVWTPSGPTARVSTGAMPGIDGVFIHDNGVGAGGHTVTGNLVSDSQGTADAAIADLTAKIAVKRALLSDGVAVFVDSGGTSHTFCKLVSYSVGAIVQEEDVGAGTWRARRSVTATLIDQDTTQVTAP